MCKSGNSPAQATANSVIASAKRLIDVRHCWCSSSRMAEISVPAWPMPIHQTKLTMAKPQPTGMLMPQMPTPRQQQVADGEEQDHDQGEREGEAEPASPRGRAESARCADLVGDRAKRVPGGITATLVAAV